MKKTRLSVTIVTGLALLMSACSGTGSTPTTSPEAGTTGSAAGGDYGGVTELNLYSQFNKGTPLGKLQEEVLKKYTEETGIKVNVADAVGDNAMEAYEAQVAAGQEADLVIINPSDKSRSWLSKGAVVDAEPYLKEWGLEAKLTDDALNGWRDKDGHLLGLPYVGFEWPVYWNKKLLAKAGVDKVPTTEDELIAAANKLNAAGIAPFVVGGGDWTGNGLLMHVMNAYAPPEVMGKVWSEGGYCSTPEVKKGLEYFVRLREAGVFIKDAEGFMMDQQNQTFFTGKAAAMSGGSWWFEDVPKEMRGDIELGGVPVPADGYYKKPLAAHGSTSGGFWISKKGAEKSKAIRKLVEMFYSQDVASKVVTDTSTLTVVKLDPAPQPPNPLLKQAVTDLKDKVEYVPMVDFYWPPSITAMASTTAQVYSKSSTADSICKALDDLYR